jgi:type IV pilus biogenesis protein CpaD/CtpE
MNEQDFVQFLQHLLAGDAIEDALDCAVDQPDSGLTPRDISVRTFREAMVFTSAKGLVVTMPDGSKFQVTVVEADHG